MRPLSHLEARNALGMGCNRFSKLVRAKVIECLPLTRPGRSGWAWEVKPESVLAYARKCRDDTIRKAHADFQLVELKLRLLEQQEGS